MTKTEITTALNSFISAIGKITKARHTSANALILDELYNNEVKDSQNDETYTSKSGSIFNYNIKIIKVGKIAHISGVITNVSGVSQPAQNVFSFKENQYKPKIAFNPINLVANNLSSASFIRLVLTSSGIYYSGSNLSLGAPYEFNFTTYITEN
jgi:hypothetical protein